MEGKIRSMTVRQLINALKDFPQSYKIYFQDHDQLEYEYNNAINSARIVDYDSIPEDQKGQEMNLKGKVVMLNP